MTDEEHRDKLYSLLPSVYRKRDMEERGEALRQFLRVLDDESLIVEENLAQLYDDMFAETAASWVLPYIAELIGLRGLPGTESLNMAPRAEVVNTIRYRRRKGTAAVLQQLARDVTRWPARAVEYFELLVSTQYMNHKREHNQSTVNIRDAGRLQWANTPFERLAEKTDLTHLVEVRRIASRRGHYNIPNIGIHLWRLRDYPVTQCPAVPAEPNDEQRFMISPLGVNMQLFSHPFVEDDITHLARPQDVPMPISRRMFSDSLETYYPRSLRIADEQGPENILVCDLSDILDAGGNVSGWAHSPPPDGKIAIDPMLGRIAFPDDKKQIGSPPRVDYYYGFSADIGGGEYDRVQTFDDLGDPVVRVSNLGQPAAHTTIAEGLTAIEPGQGIVEINDSGHYSENPVISVGGRRVEIRSADGRRAVLNLSGDLDIEGDINGQVTLNGLLIAGGVLQVNGPGTVRLRHCTLVPGISMLREGEPEQPGAASIVVASADTNLVLDSCIVGGLRVNVDARVTVQNSILDAGVTGVAYASEDESSAGGQLHLRNCTVLGKVHTRIMEMASNTIFLARRTEAEDPVRWPGPILADRRQEGCVRFSYLPTGSRTPRRYRCQPEREVDAARLRPVMTSLRYADPGYCQLDRRTPAEIRLGADDESEMGVFHDLFQPQREHYLQTRLDDYLRFGLEAGIFFVT
jgi:hypothetical protein